ncbi:4a-hydroxytetrahydrobiopterin dehydratase [Poriferisphaera sp. WC338]|uniref:4a-hydroxytetrahydrobiopterin dehydratase n=1 Tax=Poriferisphaera sp. WC338 TaxID=3425129 RepID=UPI003D812D16
MPNPTPALSEKQINQALSDLPGWSYDDAKISKTYRFKHFKEALSFIVRLSFEAEAMNHHPEIFNVYSTVKISLNTHDAGNKVTEKDIQLAKHIESLNWLPD